VSYQPPPAGKDHATARQPPGWYPDPRWYLHRTGPQVLRWWDGAQWGQQTQPLPRTGQEPQLGYPQQPYGQHSRQPSFTPDPQYGTPPGQPQYPGTPYGQHASPQAQSYGQQPGPPSGHQGRPARTSWLRRHKVLTVLGGLAALIIIGGIASATGGTKIKPTATSSPTTPAHVTARSYPNVASLLAAMAVRGAICSGATFKSGSTADGALSNFVDCSGTSAGDTAIVLFTNHAEAVAYAQSMISVGQEANSPTEEVIGPNWVVNTSPGFAPKVAKAVGGQLITTPAASATPAASTPATSAPAPAAPATSAPASPVMTASQQQAVDAAQTYLSMGSGFSQYSLLKQLTSSYGSGFSTADAQFAINYLNPDWDAQAVDAAKSYMQMGGFSAASLTQQLTSTYGDGFTQAQADYAVAQVGL
jgi:hypothetical protein